MALVLFLPHAMLVLLRTGIGQYRDGVASSDIPSFMKINHLVFMTLSSI